jgi:hypothetical protein
VLTFFCDSQRVLLPLTTKIMWQHIAQQWCNLKVEPTHLCCDCFLEYNGYPTPSLDLAQYVVCMMSARAKSNKLPDFVHIFLILFIIIHICHKTISIYHFTLNVFRIIFRTAHGRKMVFAPVSLSLWVYNSAQKIFSLHRFEFRILQSLSFLLKRTTII